MKEKYTSEMFHSFGEAKKALIDHMVSQREEWNEGIRRIRRMNRSQARRNT